MALKLDALQRTFDFLRRRKTAYQLTFGSPAGNEVLIDMAKYCRASETTFHENDRITARLEGRRDVWLRIQQHLNLNPEQLMTLYSGGRISIIDGDDDDN